MKFFEEVKRRAKISDLLYFLILGIFLSVLFFWGDNLEKNHREIIICVAITVGLFVLLGVKMWSQIELHQFAIIFIIVAGSLSLMIQPILNIPDEVAHFARAEYVSRGNIIVDSEQTEYETIQAVKELQGNVKQTYISSTVKGDEIDYSTAEIGHIAASNAVFLYFPQAIGVLIAKLLKMNAIWMLWLGRLGNLVCYAFIIGFALKIAPTFKFTLFFVSTLPMCIQQAGSCSPDAIINASAILLIAYFLYLYCTDKKEITWKQVGVFFAIAVVVTISKITNIFIAGLILLIPSEKFANKKKAIWGKCFIIGGVIIIGVLYYLYTMIFPASAEHLAYFEEVNANSSEQIKYIIYNFSEWIEGFGAALINNIQSYVNSLATFGWLEYGSTLIPVVTTFLFGKVCAQESGVYINKINKVLIFLMVAGIYASSCLALYLSWTPVGSTEILGVQGRYFIPMLALFSLLFASPSNSVNTDREQNGDIIAIISMNAVMLITTTLRYY